MIQVHKSNNIPTILQERGTIETDALKNQYEANPNHFSSIGRTKREIQKFSFDEAIYGHEMVKLQLKSEQYEKCCFCESKFSHTGYGDVEHFRPKAAYQIAPNQRLIYPAYYWLVYDWQNLFFSCQICNQKFKRNLFPLIDETRRVTNHLQAANLSEEQPYLIHLSAENPETFIYFEKEIPKTRENNLRGRKTIEITGLDRKELNDRRLEYLKAMENIKLIAGIDISDEAILQQTMRIFNRTEQEVIVIIENSKTIYQSATTKEAEYANMVRSNLTL